MPDETAEHVPLAEDIQAEAYRPDLAPRPLFISEVGEPPGDGQPADPKLGYCLRCGGRGRDIEYAGLDYRTVPCPACKAPGEPGPWTHFRSVWPAVAAGVVVLAAFAAVVVWLSFINGN